MGESINRLLHMGMGLILFIIGCFITFQGFEQNQEVVQGLSQKWHDTYKTSDEQQSIVNRQPYFSGAVVMKLCLDAHEGGYEVLLNGQPYLKMNQIISQERIYLLNWIQLEANYSYEMMYVDDQVKKIEFERIN